MHTVIEIRRILFAENSRPIFSVAEAERGFGGGWEQVKEKRGGILQSGGARHHSMRQALTARGLRESRLARSALCLTVVLWAGCPAWPGRAQSPKAETALPEAPRPQSAAHVTAAEARPCQVRRAGGAMAMAAAQAGAVAAGVVDPAASDLPDPATQQVPCPPYVPLINWYSRFLNGPQVKPMTPREKGWLAVRNVIDPFNGITILGSSAIAVGSNAYSPYGPGMRGFRRYVGVSYAQDMAGEFFGTFLIPTIVRQDPHYHRMPNAAMKRRIAHALYQVVWTQGDNGKGMLNYADVVGFAFDDEIGNLYVPGQKTNLPASAARYGIGLATAPIDNFVTEFLPDVARRIHIQVVVIQQIINQVARTDATQGEP